MIDAETRARLAALESHLRSRIIDQDHLLGRLAAVFHRGELGLSEGARPKGSVFLTGPTGTGKSESLVSAVEYVLGPGQLVTFDMSEYQEPTAVRKFLGAGPDDPGLLGRALASSPSGALFFDEIEKAYPPLLDVFLQILWEGRVTVATGRTFTFGGYYIAIASNLGGTEAMRMERSNVSSVEQAVLRRVRQSLRPELLARLDEVLVFRRLAAEAQRRICALVLARELTRLGALGHEVTASPTAIEFLVREGFDPHLGARPLRKTVERYVRDALVEHLFASGSARGRLERDPLRRRLRLTSPGREIAAA